MANHWHDGLQKWWRGPFDAFRVPPLVHLDSLKTSLDSVTSMRIFPSPPRTRSLPCLLVIFKTGNEHHRIFRIGPMHRSAGMP